MYTSLNENNTTLFSEINKKLYVPNSLQITNMAIDAENHEYEAYRFELNNKVIHWRKAKVTPKKMGQFVTFWKRSSHGPIAPYDLDDQFDFLIINVLNETSIGQFIFPKEILLKKGIISSNEKEGKRGFRVYPPWSLVQNRQAISTQKWQLAYFLAINNSGCDRTQMKSYYDVD